MTPDITNGQTLNLSVSGETNILDKVTKIVEGNFLKPLKKYKVYPGFETLFSHVNTG